MRDKKIKKDSSPRGHGPGGGPRGMMKGVEKAKDFKGTMKKLIDYLSVYKNSILVVILFAIASTIFLIIGPKVLGSVTTEIFEGIMKKIAGTGNIDFDSIRNTLLILAGLYMISAVFRYIQNYIMAGVSMKVSYKLRKDISEKINLLPLKYFDTT
ncbi:MAG: ABC transporter transmembrane domain-containing protein, partial [Senegalia sp. (in: firmicutes)]|uniref:ABC transporter transmembrane domain-containing protein n=1 Tax=Senegalia sp. (in: firmicutes) TaxID=1924098 RepID=UPI003F9E1827